MESKKDNKQRIQIGVSSLVLIFTVLCLVVFATLSLASAKADYRLAEKNEQSVQAYYKVDGEGEKLKRQVDRKLEELAQQAGSSAQFQELVKESFPEAFDQETDCINYALDTDTEQFLSIQLQLKSFEEIGTGGENFIVRSWNIQNKVDYQIDDSMPVWDGGDIFE
ncbi:hypothetical protein Ami103574_03850 [Aminipila butyrica]|uniref:Uncharacterized protein n=1 Tax=Aminipila butyrica TaxID=433296 RepID=A0A858BRI7_9FIRM|nr:hypothetical protein [Aminipila butyrica]QIB68503.1 hypothetical protein Ami103574_03850 [Aminipila butyrica]